MTDGGTVNSAALVESVTETPPPGAGLGSDTVQVALVWAVRVAEAQVSEETMSGPLTDIRKLWLAPLRPAVTLAAPSARSVPADAANDAETAPAAIVTELGTVMPA